MIRSARPAPPNYELRLDQFKEKQVTATYQSGELIRQLSHVVHFSEDQFAFGNSVKRTALGNGLRRVPRSGAVLFQIDLDPARFTTHRLPFERTLGAANRFSSTSRVPRRRGSYFT
jgi:hypothetical protein